MKAAVQQCEAGSSTSVLRQVHCRWPLGHSFQALWVTAVHRSTIVHLIDCNTIICAAAQHIPRFSSGGVETAVRHQPGIVALGLRCIGKEVTGCANGGVSLPCVSTATATV